MIKKQGIYRVTIYSNENTIIVKSPITAQINITRGVMCDATKATVKLYNLAPSTRNSIFQDVFTYDIQKRKYVHVEAGYGNENSMSMIFKGRILQAYSYKSGSQTDVITEIQAQALDILDCQTSITVEAGTSKREVIQQCVNDMPNVILGNMGNIEGNFLTSTTFEGNSLNTINEIVGGNAFVDNGVLNILLNNEVLDVPVPVITDDSALLETPMRRDANLTVRMLFQPDLVVAQLLEIKSSISPNFNGQYKVLGFTHDLTFGDGIAGSRTTTVDLWIGPLLPGALEALQSNKIDSNFNKVKGFDISTVNPAPVGRWLKPVKGKVTSPYGRRPRPIKGASTQHNALDIGVPVGTPVKAPADGNVDAAKLMDGYGYCIFLFHGILNGVRVDSRYAHLSKFAVRHGQNVKAGEIIGYSGGAKGAPGAGYSTAPHLHFEIRENGEPVNPIKYVGAY